MLKWGIRSRLIVSYILLTMTILVLLGSYILWFFHRNNLESLTNHLFHQALLAERLIEDYYATGNIDKINTIIQPLGKSVDFRLTVINNEGTVLADSEYEKGILENHRQRPEIAAALAGDRGYDIHYNARANENWLYSAVPLYHNDTIIGVVRVSTSLSYVEAGYKKIVSALLIAFLITILVVILLSIQLARRYTAPLEKITKVATAYSEGNLNSRIHIRTGDELEILAHTLNTLAHNLTEKVNEITAEKQKLELILQHMDNAVVLLDRPGRVTAANQAAVTLFGITPTMFGQHNLQVIGNGALDYAIKQSISSATSNLIHLKTSLQDKRRILQVFISPITDSDHTIHAVLTVFHDITALQEIQERQTDFVANASHELATPLTTIKGFAETLLDGALEDPELRVKFVTIIATEADRMQKLIQDLLKLAKLSSQDYLQQLTLVPINPEAILTGVVDELRPQWKRKNLILSINCPSALPLVMANSDWLKQILVNLVENSIKYTPADGKITIHYWAEQDRGYFMVKDSGIGIPSKDLPLIFERFYRVDRARARSAGGTGLGLAIVKFIVELLGGTISVKSKVNVGTTFIFHLPLAK